MTVNLKYGLASHYFSKRTRGGFSFWTNNKYGLFLQKYYFTYWSIISNEIFITQTITIKVPSSLRVTSFEIGMLVASTLFEQGKLSSGQAAEMVGLSKRTFLELIGKYNVSVFGYDFDEVESDLKNV